MTSFRFTRMDDDLWIGLYNEDQLNGVSMCSCDGCDECRDRFDWVDPRVEQGYIEWADPVEPQAHEACVRMTYNNLKGYNCSNEFGYICYQGA